MILFSNAKINIALHILRKRDDAYHDISSLFYPVPFQDIIEIHVNPNEDSGFTFTQSGLDIAGELTDNLCYKAWTVFTNKFGKISARVHLHKIIPMGAGLGGGSSNGAFVLKGLYDLTGSPFSMQELAGLAAEIGSDCPFFIYNQSSIAEGRGEILKKAAVNLEGYFLVIIHPAIHISTSEAYSNIIPDQNRTALKEVISKPIKDWKNLLKNDFEVNIFKRYPEIGDIKTSLYNQGALYASMTGSGSAVYGIFSNEIRLPEKLEKLLAWKGFL